MARICDRTPAVSVNGPIEPLARFRADCIRKIGQYPTESLGIHGLFGVIFVQDTVLFAFHDYFSTRLTY
jgi:hypothetical protein